MLGQHPDLCGFPELSLFCEPTFEVSPSDPPVRDNPDARSPDGLYRALAEHNSGVQTPTTVVEATRWLDARRNWSGAHVYDHLLALAAPRIGVEKSPENSRSEDALRRLHAAYPRARFLHLTRHPLTSARSIYEHSRRLNVSPSHDACLGFWYSEHRRIRQFTEAQPRDRWLRVRSEDILNAPDATLPRICRWLGVDASPEAVKAMRHPERSPYARRGPSGAGGGADRKFLEDPVLHPAELPAALGIPPTWIEDPRLWFVIPALSKQFGYQ